MSKIKLLFIQPEFNNLYVPAFPVYEPLHGLLLDAVGGDLVDSFIFDRRFDTDKNLVKVIDDFKPDIVATTTHTAGEIGNVKRLLGLTKKVRPEALTLIGGQHATLLPEDLFDDSIDLICIGPGEDPFREIIEAYHGKSFDHIEGIAIRESGSSYYFTRPRIIKSGQFSWPHFNRDLILPRYKKHYGFVFEQRSNIYTITTMGCPYRCTFCSLWATARGAFRYREPEEVVNEIISLPQKYVHLTDDNTFHNSASAEEIYRLLKKKNVNKKILAYARTDKIVQNPDIIAKWAEVGLGALVVGMEAVNDTNLKSLNKSASLETNIKAQKILDDLGIENWAHFVINPDFVKEDFDEIWDFVEEYNLTYPIYVANTPVAGTPAFFDAKDSGQLTTFDYGYYNLQYMVMKTALDKREWYERYWGLFLKSAQMKTLWKRRKSNSFHLRPALGRAYVMGTKAYKLIMKNIDEQIRRDNLFDYDTMQHLLPPSLRKDYVPNNYYNAASIKDMNSRSKEAASGKRIELIST